MDQLKAMAASGELSPTDLVWKEGMAGWEPASSLPGLFQSSGGLSLEKPRSDSQPAQAPMAQTTVLPPGVSPMGPRTNPMALTGMILGIVSVTLGLCCYGVPFNIAGVIFSAIGLSQINADPQNQTGKGMAIAGIVCSVLSLLLAILMVLVFGMSAGFSEVMNRR